MSDLIELKNSSYARKHIIDAEDLMFNFRLILEKSGTKALSDFISATGQNPELMEPEQLINAVVQMVVASNLFKDIGTRNNISLVAYTDSYGIPTQLIHNMSINFMVKDSNSGNTTITIPNLGTKKLLSETGEELLPNTLLGNTVYTATYNSLTDTFNLKATQSDASIALNSIVSLINSANITFSSATSSQLSQSVALYSLQHTYENIIVSNDEVINNYRLIPFSGYISVPFLVEGMVFRFKPLFTNTLSTVTIQIGNLNRISLFNAKGKLLNIGDIVSNTDVVIKYSAGKFYLVSNTLSSLSLQNNVTVNTISNDSTLSNGSGSSLVTENAVKQYVDAKDKINKGYTVVSGTENFLTPIPGGVRVLAGNGVEPPYYNMALENNSLSSPCRAERNTVLIGTVLYEGTNGEITISGNTYVVENNVIKYVIVNMIMYPVNNNTVVVDGVTYIVSDNEVEIDNVTYSVQEYPVTTYTYGISNCFDGDNTTFFETEAQGSDVQGEGTMGPAGMEYTTYPCFIEVTGLENYVKRVRLLCNKPSTMPTQVFFEYSLDGVNWQKVGEVVSVSEGGSVVSAVKPIIYNVDSISSVFTDIDLIIGEDDTTGENIYFKPYIDATNPDLGVSTSPYSLRCYAYSFPEQVPDTSEGNYVHGWQIVGFQFCYQDSSTVEPLVLSYDDQTPEIVNNYTDIDLSTEVEGTPDYPDGTYVVLKYLNSNYEVIPSAFYKEGSQAPIISGTTPGLYRWVDIHDGLIITKVYKQISTNPVTYEWQERSFVKLGTITKSTDSVSLISTISTNCVAFNGKVELTGLDFDSTTNTIKKTVTHNIGSLSRGKVYLRCISTETQLGFDVGDTIELVNQATIANTTSPTITIQPENLTGTTENIGGATYSVSVSPDPHDHNITIGSTTTKVLYTTIVCGYNTLKIYSNGITIGTNQVDTVSEIDYTKWKLDIICERAF